MNKRKLLIYALIGAFFSYWVALKVFKVEPESDVMTGYSAGYIVIAFLGGVFGILQSRKWGGHKSLLGKALLLFSIGLLAITIGSLVITFNVLVFDEELPYPSVAEIFYFSGNLAYIIGAIFLARTIRSWQVLERQPLFKKLFLALLPLVMVGIVVGLFVSKYDGSEATSLQVAVDFAYAITQALYALLALGVLLNSSQLFGGVLRKAVVLLLIALLAQYAADTNYSFQSLSGSSVTGGYGDLMYMIAYSLMALSILMFQLPTIATAKTPSETTKEAA